MPMTRRRLAGPRRMLVLPVVLAVVASLGLAAAPASAQTTPRAFDAVTTQWEGGRWKHLGIKNDRYVVFDDRRVYEEGLIRNKWPFLPSAFHTNLNAAAVIMDGSLWRYTFVKGNQIVEFNDNRIINQVLPPFGNVDAFTIYYAYSVPAYVASVGSNLFSWDSASGVIRPSFQVPSFVPFDFRSNFDDISAEQEGDAFKVSLYKGYERLIYVDSVFGADYFVERVNVRNKWPHLNTFFNTTA